MNIFEALSKGKGCINEENVSSFLGYLLDPNEDHGLGTVFLEKFLKKLYISQPEIETIDIDNFEIELEFPVKQKKENRIDLVFKTNKHIIAIENKILECSKRKGQLQDEYDGLKKSEYCKNSNRDIIMCYLVPEIDDETLFIKIDEEDKLYTIRWEDVTNVLIEILSDENAAKIPPLDDYFKYTLKAFINFMNNSAKPKYFPVSDKNYRMYKYSSGKILIETEADDKWMPVDNNKTVIRQKLKDILKEEFSYDKDRDTTRSLGAKLYKILPS